MADEETVKRMGKIVSNKIYRSTFNVVQGVERLRLTGSYVTPAEGGDPCDRNSNTKYCDRTMRWIVQNANEHIRFASPDPAKTNEHLFYRLVRGKNLKLQIRHCQEED